MAVHNEQFADWEIIHIPGNSPLSLEDSTVNVVAAKIEPKLASAIIRQLNQISPLENLRHVKRVKKENFGGKVELSIILCILSESEISIEAVPIGVRQLVDKYNLSIFAAKVSRYQATSKEEWEEQCKLWPTSFHPPTNPEGVSSLDEKEITLIYSFMKNVIRLAQSNIQHKVVNAAIVVDPSNGETISTAQDETSSEEFVSLNSNNECTKPKYSENHGVACVNPWKWMEKSCEGDFIWHPLKHAAMVAIENAAARDRKMFGNLMPFGDDFCYEFWNDGSAKRLKTTENEAHLTKEDSECVRPYLCTGFDIYLAWEPCPMCAMALVHQRFKRIFYAFPNPKVGALESVHRLHGQKSLNHHYSVFRILIPDKALNDIFPWRI